METGSIPVEDLPGGFDLQSTVESGQSYLWRREDGRMYETTHAYGGSAWYYTVVDGRGRSRPPDGTACWSGRRRRTPNRSSFRSSASTTTWTR